MGSGKPLIVIAGAAAQVPRYGGHAWVFLQYVLGFRRLGYEVRMIDRLQAAAQAERRRIVEVFTRAGAAESLSVLDPDGRPLVGPERTALLDECRRSALLINVNGVLGDEPLLAAARRRLFLDIDPGFPQMWRALGLADVLAGHHVFASFAANIGRDGCAIPSCGLDWIPTRPPVVLSEWPVRAAAGEPSFATIGGWRGPFAPVQYEGERYGLRAHEFRPLAGLPAAAPATRFRAALDIDPADAADRRALADGGWELLDPAATTADPWAYREFVAGAGAELMVAKEMYAKSRGGWFSDRSACFLASGKPVLARDTGIGSTLPAGDGLVLFETPSQAQAGVASILGDYAHHAGAARALAEEWFDSDRVLGELLLQAGAR